MRVAQVFVNIPVRTIAKAFSYIIPPALSEVDIGWRVVVPFGPRTVEGFVVAVTDDDDGNDLKAISAVLDDAPWFDQHMLKLAQWLSEYYLCSLGEALRLFIPGKAGVKSVKSYRVTHEAEFSPKLAALTVRQQQVLTYIREHKTATIKQIINQFGVNETAAAIRYLKRHGFITANQVMKKTAQQKYHNVVKLAISADEARQLTAKLTKMPAQQRVIGALLNQGTLGPKDLRQLKISRDTLTRLTEKGIIAVEKARILRDSYAGFSSTKSAVDLTPAQQQAVTAITKAIEAHKFQSFLLHGVTGSGKTEVYLEAVAAVRAKGRQAIVLVPEIALTGQIVTRFKARFGDDVVVMHSKLSVGERFDTWQRLREREAGIVIGARSAVFASADDLGIIIIDEEHEFTYKQEEAPRYHTREVALMRAKLLGAAVVLGSATPAVETYYQALQGGHQLLSMPTRIDGCYLPEVTVVDMREEFRQGRRSVISKPLEELLQATLAKGEQAVILLNRRGYSTFVSCRECGHVMKCPHCDVSMVYHVKGSLLRCHYCQATVKNPDLCPACGSRYIRYFGTGTQKLEEELAKLLPSARIIRMDQDTTGGKMAHDKILRAFASRKYDILLGTQMVAKGHDVKNVTAVGIIAADTALNLPDFRAAEKTFSLLTQAAGRAGRGGQLGKVVVQTYNPEHYSIKAGAVHDYERFYQAEIEFRRALFYPPFSKLIKITVQADNEGQAFRDAERVAADLKNKLRHLARTEIIGPFTAPIAKLKDTFRVNLLIKTAQLAEVAQQILALGLNIAPNIFIDVEPVSML